MINVKVELGPMLLGQHAKIRKGKMQGYGEGSPLSGYFNVGCMALTGTVIFCVDSDVLLAARTVLFVDPDFFLAVAGTVFLAGKSS